MFTLPRLTARLAVITAFAALAAACNTDSNGPSSKAPSNPALLAEREGRGGGGGGGGAAASSFAVLANAAVTCGPDGDGRQLGGVTRARRGK
ncbi:MAG TPA: hypothetical protein VFD73_08055 [Gemmatimonadales bacterium]|nr:hypothetical protein [Gemmatimonadales bacterium]